MQRAPLFPLSSSSIRGLSLFLFDRVTLIELVGRQTCGEFGKNWTEGGMRAGAASAQKRPPLGKSERELFPAGVTPRETIFGHLLPSVANARATYLPEGYLRLRLRYQLVASSDPSSLRYGSQAGLCLNSAADFAAMADIDNQEQQAIVAGQLETDHRERLKKMRCFQPVVPIRFSISAKTSRRETGRLIFIVSPSCTW